MSKLMPLYVVCLRVGWILATGLMPFSSRAISEELLRYHVQVRIIEFNEGGPGINSSQFDSQRIESDPSQQMVILYPNFNVKSDSFTITSDGPDLKIEQEVTLQDAPVRIVSSPSLTQYADTEAEIRVGSPVIQYFEPTDGALYELKTLDEPIGVAMNFRVSSNDRSSNLITMQLAFEWSRVASREPVEGINLDVGKPTVTKGALQKTIDIKLNSWIGIMQTGTPMLIAVKVSQL